ncbi:hypothetical protein [Flaviaesturariibacter amylovorans]|uniref:Leucine-rich repeat domain-containing protein n=1 Tax=Flaviaesturariibacter amylovorans TaxID=1084520 RepID=A0ABP8G8A0_9BACT
MGFRFSGIAIDRAFDPSDLTAFSVRFGCKTLVFKETVPMRKALDFNFDEEYIDFYIGATGTIAFCASPLLVEDLDLERASFGHSVASFTVDETSMLFTLQQFKDGQPALSYSALDGQVQQSVTDGYQFKDGLDLSMQLIEKTSGTSFWSLGDGTRLHRFVPGPDDLRSHPAYLELSAQIAAREEPAEAKQEAARPQLPALADTGQVLDLLMSTDDADALKAIDIIRQHAPDRKALSYLLNVAYFHRDTQVKKEAKKLLGNIAPDGLLAHIAEHWEPKYLKEQYYYTRMAGHPAIDYGEYLVLGQVTRNNYYQKKPKAWGDRYSSMHNDAEIEQVFDCYACSLTQLPDSFLKLQHVTVVNFSMQTELDVRQAIGQLAKLPRLEKLLLQRSGLEQLPDTIFSLRHLRILDINTNPIAQLPAGTFPLVEKLTLSQTGITELDLAQFPALKVLRLEGEQQLKNITFKNVTTEFLASSGSNGMNQMIRP